MQLNPRRPHLHRICYCSLSFLSMFFSFLHYLFVPPISVNPLPFICFSFSHILTIHPYLTSFLSWHLFLFVFKEGGGRNLLSYDLYCAGHFFINAANKTVAHHLMRRQQATLNWKLPLWSQILSLSLSLSLSSYPSPHLEHLRFLWLIPSSPRVTFLLGPRARGIPTPILQLFNFIIDPRAPTETFTKIVVFQKLKKECSKNSIKWQMLLFYIII